MKLGAFLILDFGLTQEDFVLGSQIHRPLEFLFHLLQCGVSSRWPSAPTLEIPWLVYDLPLRWLRCRWRRAYYPGAAMTSGKAFGGQAAHIAIIEDELVRRRRWLSREKFLDLLGASNLIPGPSSSELVMHIGYLCAGWRGLLIAGTCFILSAALMVAGIGWLYVRFGGLPAARRHPLRNLAGRHRRRPSGPLESGTHSSEDNISWIRGGACARAICSRFASTAIASAGRWSSVRACAKNLASVLLSASFF